MCLLRSGEIGLDGGGLILAFSEVLNKFKGDICSEFSCLGLFVFLRYLSIINATSKPRLRDLLLFLNECFSLK